MELTNKARRKLITYLANNNTKVNLSIKQDAWTDTWSLFDSLPLSMKWGVYLEFFDSLGYDLDVSAYDKEEWYMGVYKEGLVVWERWKSKDGLTRQEAQIEAIKKLNEIINK